MTAEAQRKGGRFFSLALMNWGEMKKARLLLLAIPLVMGVFYLWVLAWWRPQKVFEGSGAVSEWVFSRDGKTLLVAQNPFTGKSPRARLMALDVSHGFTSRWMCDHTLDVGKPQVCASA